MPCFAEEEEEVDCGAKFELAEPLFFLMIPHYHQYIGKLLKIAMRVENDRKCLPAED